MERLRNKDPTSNSSRSVGAMPRCLNCKRRAIGRIWWYSPPYTLAQPHRLDATHGSLTAARDKLGKPLYPTQAQIVQLRRASEIPRSESILPENGKITISLPPQGLAIIDIR